MKRIILLLIAILTTTVAIKAYAGSTFACQLNGKGQDNAPCLTGSSIYDIAKSFNTGSTTPIDYKNCNTVNGLIKATNFNNSCKPSSNSDTQIILFKTDSFKQKVAYGEDDQTPYITTPFLNVIGGCAGKDWDDPESDILACLDSSFTGDNGGSSSVTAQVEISTKIVLAGYNVATVFKNLNETLCLGDATCGKSVTQIQMTKTIADTVQASDFASASNVFQNNIVIFRGNFSEDGTSCSAEDKPCGSYSNLTVDIADNTAAFKVKSGGHLTLRNLYITINNGSLAEVEAGGKIEMSNVVIETKASTLPAILIVNAKASASFGVGSEPHGVKFIGANKPIAGFIKITGNLNDATAMPLQFSAAAVTNPNISGDALARVYLEYEIGRNWSNDSSYEETGANEKMLYGSYFLRSAGSIPAIASDTSANVVIDGKAVQASGIAETDRCFVTVERKDTALDNEQYSALLFYKYSTIKKEITASNFTIMDLVDSDMVCGNKKVVFKCKDGQYLQKDSTVSGGYSCKTRPVELEGPAWVYDSSSREFTCKSTDNTPKIKVGSTACYFGKLPYGSSKIDNTVVCDSTKTEQRTLTDAFIADQLSNGNDLLALTNEKPFICITKCPETHKNTFDDMLEEDQMANIVLGYMLGTLSAESDKCVYDINVARAACNAKTDLSARTFDETDGSCDCTDTTKAEDPDSGTCMPMLTCDTTTTDANSSSTQCICKVTNGVMSSDGLSCGCAVNYTRVGSFCRANSELECTTDSDCASGYECSAGYECTAIAECSSSDDCDSGYACLSNQCIKEENACADEGQTLLEGNTTCSCEDGYVCYDRDTEGNCLCEVDDTPICAGDEELVDNECVKIDTSAPTTRIKGGCASSISEATLSEKAGQLMPFLVILALLKTIGLARKLGVKRSALTCAVALISFVCSAGNAVAAETCTNKSTGYLSCWDSPHAYYRIIQGQADATKNYSYYHEITSTVKTWYKEMNNKIGVPNDLDGYAPLIGESNNPMPYEFCAEPCQVSDDYSMENSTLKYIAKAKDQNSSYYFVLIKNNQFSHEDGVFYYGVKLVDTELPSKDYKVVRVLPVNLDEEKLVENEYQTTWESCSLDIGGNKTLANGSVYYVDSASVKASCSFSIPSDWTASIDTSKKVTIMFDGTSYQGSIQQSGSKITISATIQLSGKYNSGKNIVIGGISSGLDIYQDEIEDTPLPVRVTGSTYSNIKFVYTARTCPEVGTYPTGANANECKDSCKGEYERFNSSTFKCECTDANYAYDSTKKACVYTNIPACNNGTVNASYQCVCDPGYELTDDAKNCVKTETPVTCSTNNNCPSGEKCSSGTCVDDGGDDTCSTATDCSYGEACGNDGKCYVSSGCTVNSQCGAGFSCIDGECKIPSSGSTTCTFNDDCAFGLVCSSDNKCVTPDEEITSCEYSIDCPSGYVCNNSTCTTSSYDQTTCSEDSDCSSDEICDLTTNVCVDEEESCSDDGMVWDSSLNECVCDIDNGWYMDDGECVQDEETSTCESEGGTLDDEGNCVNSLKTACIAAGNEWVSQKCVSPSVSENSSTGGCSLNSGAANDKSNIFIILSLLIPLAVVRNVTKRQYERS